MVYQEYLVKSGTFSDTQLAQLETYRGNVHSIFHRTMNLIDENETLLTLSTDELDAAPQTLQLSNFFPNESIRQGMRVVGGNNCLLVDSKWRFDFKNMVSQRIEQPTFFFHSALSSQLVFVTKQIRQKKKEKVGVTAFEQAVYSKLEEVTTAFEQAILVNDKKEIERQINQLIGLGIGLTPSGDDYLTGFFLVTGMNQYPYPWVNRLLSELFSKSAGKTNSISQTQMKLALNGQARERLVLFLKEMMQETTDVQLEKRKEEVLKIGSSSGEDILKGMLAGIKLTIQLGGKK